MFSRPSGVCLERRRARPETAGNVLNSGKFWTGVVLAGVREMQASGVRECRQAAKRPIAAIKGPQGQKGLTEAKRGQQGPQGAKRGQKGKRG